jgi:hypothetical protein
MSLKSSSDKLFDSKEFFNEHWEIYQKVLNNRAIFPKLS